MNQRKGSFGKLQDSGTLIGEIDYEENSTCLRASIYRGEAIGVWVDSSTTVVKKASHREFSTSFDVSSAPGKGQPKSLDWCIPCILPETSRDIKRRHRLSLIPKEELPEWYEHNPYILRHYRDPKGLTFCACAASVCSIHNETGNIWTHLIGGVIWVLASISALTSPLMAHQVESETFWLCAACYAMCGVMPTMSTLAHLFYCQSPDWYSFCWSADHIGILLLWYARAILDGYLTIGWCQSTSFFRWAMCSTVVFTAAAYLMIQDSSRALKLFIPLYAFIHVPLLHLTIYEDVWGNPPEEIWRSFLLSSMGSLCGVLGCAIKVCNIPECWYPGKLDILGHSHQWWHVLTIVGPLLCMAAGVDLLDHRCKFPCA